MRVIAAILADLDTSPIGTRSRLAEPLAGQAILRRTVARALRVTGLESVHVMVSSARHGQAQALLSGLAAVVHATDPAPAPHQMLVATARKWALHNWRGGIGGSCAFDESFHAAGLRALAAAVQADGVMVVPGHAALLNVELAQRMLEHFQEHGPQYMMTFAQSPPGLTPLFIATAMLVDLEKAGYPPGMILSYNPAAPEPDLVGKPICYQTPTQVACTAGRLLADTGESFAACQAAIETLGEQMADNALAVCGFLASYRRQHVAPLPAELEVELTTGDSLPDTPLRPRGKAVPDRGCLDLALLDKVFGELGRRDDALVVFGGFGDPLCHAQWQQAVSLARHAGIFGIGVHTTGKQLAQVGAEAILAAGPDLLIVWLDAATQDLYRSLNGDAGYQQAVDGVLALEDGRKQHRQVKPLIVPAMTKATATVPNLEAFVDFWTGKVGSCWVEGYSNRAGQCPDRQVASMAPPGRTPCRRLAHRALMLADGRVVACDQDFRAVQVVGDARVQTLSEIWQGDAMQRLRAYAPGGGPSVHSPPLCDRCHEWARP